MADTADRRAEGRTTTPEAKSRRDRYMRLASLGLCSYCGKNPVKGRRTCYECSDRNLVATRISALRTLMQQVTGYRKPNPENYTDKELVVVAKDLMRLCK